MTRKLPEDAFAFYVALGTERSYEAVAKHYHATKRAVVKIASREQWAKRLQAIEKKTRELTDEKLADTLHERDMRHRKLVMAMASRAAMAIQQYPLASGMEGIKAGHMAIKLDLLLAGEPVENKTLTIERTTRDEMAKFLTTAPESDDEWDELDEDDDEPDDDDGAAAVAAPG